MRLLVSLITSSLGRKYLMAITGLLMFTFLIGHALGNILYFSGQSALNNYAQALKALPFGLLWIVRFGLFSLFCLHVVIGVSLWVSNFMARPRRYVFQNTVQATIASRTMIYSGAFIFTFVVYHIAHFTLHLVGHAQGFVEPGPGRPDVFAMVQAGFRQPPIAAWYIAAMAILLLHLIHGLASMFQSMGIRHKNIDWITDHLSPWTGWLVVAAFVSLPVLILSGLQ